MIQHLYEWIKHPERLNRDTLYELRTLLARYPYFQTVRLLYLKNLFLLHDIAFGEELRRSALYITDRKVLFYIVEGDRYMLKALEKQVQPEEKNSVDRTLALIDAFLSSLPEETISETPLPVTPVSDYASYLLQEEASEPVEIPKMKGQELIDNFLENQAEEVPVLLPKSEEAEEMEETEDMDKLMEETEDESYFTETLAKIYVKQQRYSKALEIIRRLNLKYPKKNAYFADQIRFLEKLIINTKSN